MVGGNSESRSLLTAESEVVFGSDNSEKFCDGHTMPITMHFGVVVTVIASRNINA